MTIPISRVVLYTSGVGYFEHEGTVDGDAQLRLLFSAEQINDVLKSMVLSDLDGGSVRGVTYPSQEPLEKALRSYEIDISGELSVASLLRQLRGSRVTVHGTPPVEGTVLDVETHTSVHGASVAVTETHDLVLTTPDGIRRVPLSGVERFSLADPRLQTELDQALALLADARNRQRRPLDIHFRGEGTRRVRVGYLLEAAVWKTSYRLDLTAETPRLQGWATVDNTSGSDWKDVSLSLVSGRPVSFVQDLYTPKHVERPVVEDEVEALRPPVAEAAFAASAPVAKERMRAMQAVVRDEAGWGGMDRGVEPRAAREVAGELVTYTLSEPVTIPRRSSSTIPILAEDAHAERTSLYDEAVHDSHPLSAVTLENRSGTTWMPGPITVFDAGIYAGDARIDYVPSGDDRVITYALDLEVLLLTMHRSPRTTRIVATRPGELELEDRVDHIVSYRVHNKGGRKKSVIVQTDIVRGAELVEPADPWKRTRRRYRFRLELDGGERQALRVVQRTTISRTLAVGDLDETALRVWSNAEDLDPAIRKRLETALGIRRELGALEATAARHREELAAIAEDQERLGKNLERTGAESAVGRRYLTKLDEQETRIETLTNELAALDDDMAARRQALADAVAP